MKSSIELSPLDLSMHFAQKKQALKRNIDMIPRIIHVFWGGKTNPCVDACIRRMADINPSWRVVHYTDFNEAEEIDGFDKLQIAH